MVTMGTAPIKVLRFMENRGRSLVVIVRFNSNPKTVGSIALMSQGQGKFFLSRSSLYNYYNVKLLSNFIEVATEPQLRRLPTEPVTYKEGPALEY